MISFALKQAWFWLALIGLVQCWITLMFGGRSIGGLWGRLYYCIFVTLLEGMFCIGMVWHMDPRRMPHKFCVAQTISFSLASFALTGLASSFALACSIAVFRPGSVNTGRAVLAWHPRYIPLVVFFPGVAGVAHITLTITLDTVQPALTDDLHCDATNPIWMRLIGYAGVPLVISIPFLILSVFTAFRLFQLARGRGFTYSTDVDGVPPSLGSYDPHPQIPRSQTRFSSFLPYGSQLGYKRDRAVSTAASVASPGKESEFPLHQHPFPPVDPTTGQAYSPSLEEPDVVSFTIPAVSPPVVDTLDPLPQAHTTNQSRNLSPHERSGRSDSATPDSAFSSSMPVFASNPALPGRTLTLAQTSGTAVRLHAGSEVQIGVAITTEESPIISNHEESLAGDEGEMVGLAVTTDEPDPRMPTPTLRHRTPSPLKNEARVSPAPSDTQTVQDTSRSQDSSGGRPFIVGPAFGLGLGPNDRTRSSESIARTLPSPGHPLNRLAYTNHSAPHALSSTGRSASHSQLPEHQRQASFVSSATFFSDRENRELLPFSPTSASSVHSPMTPKDMGDMGIIALALDRSTGRREADDHGRDDDDVKDVTVGWEDEYNDEDHGIDMPMRTVKSRDPRERLGVYNPTPTSPTALTWRPKLRKRQVPTGKCARGLGSAIWRMVLFQIAFFVVQLLASLSSIIDVVHHRLTPFGTQHVALLLAAWGPLFIFAQVPKRLRKFWEHQQ